MKKTSFLLSVLLLIVSIAPLTLSAETIASGACDDHLTWVLNDGTLTVSGIGEMEENAYTGYGWKAYSDRITALVIGQGVTEIGDMAFQGCQSLATVTLPNSVTEIGEFAFDGCSALSDITLPGSVAEIGEYAFRNTAYYNDESNWESGVLYIGSCLIAAKNSLSETYGVKEGTSLIADHAFRGCTGLTGITIPNSIKYIEEDAFFGCSGLTSITIPDSVTKIDEDAFETCKNLTICGSKGSYAESYAAAHGISFQTLGAPAGTESTNQTTSNTNSANGTNDPGSTDSTNSVNSANHTSTGTNAPNSISHAGDSQEDGIPTWVIVLIIVSVLSVLMTFVTLIIVIIVVSKKK